MLFRTCEKLNLTLTHIKIISPAASGFQQQKKENFVTQVHICTANTELSLTDCASY